jgi:hypothetical protein
VPPVSSRFLEEEGLCEVDVDDGWAQVSGRHAIVQELQHKVERNERAFRFNPLTDDVYAVASLLKVPAPRPPVCAHRT